MINLDYFDFDIEISVKTWVEKHLHNIFFMFGSKTNEFGWKKSEKTENIEKSSEEYKSLRFYFSELFLSDQNSEKSRQKAN